METTEADAAVVLFDPTIDSIIQMAEVYIPINPQLMRGVKTAIVPRSLADLVDYLLSVDAEPGEEQ